MTMTNNINPLSSLYESTPEVDRQELIRKLCKALDCSERVFYNKRKGITKITRLEQKIIKKFSR